MLHTVDDDCGVSRCMLLAEAGESRRPCLLLFPFNIRNEDRHDVLRVSQGMLPRSSEGGREWCG